MTALVTKHLPLVAEASDGIERLRTLILDVAIQGLLTSQTASGFADELVEPSVGEIVPFRLPPRWHWSTVGDECELENGDRSSNYPNKSCLVPSGVPFINAGHLNAGRIDLDEMTFISRDRFDMLRSGKVKQGDLLYCLRGSLGKVALVDCIDEGAIASSLVIVRPGSAVIPRYLLVYFNTSLVAKQISTYDNGTAQPNLAAGSLRKFVLPVPSPEEQHRIVAKVDELMALCDRLEADQADAEAAHAQLVQALLDSLTQATDAADFRASWQRLSEHFHTLFTTEASIDALKQTVLQLAVMGRLETQVESDGTAADLLAAISTRRKSRAPLPPIECDASPPLPSRWCWVHIADLAHVGTGATPSRTNPGYFNPPEINWVTSGETSQAFVSATEQKVSPLALSETNLTVYPAGTLVVAMYGQGKTRGQVTELLIDACTNQACAAIQLVCDDIAHRRYVKYFFEKSYDELRSLAAGGAQPNLNLGKIKETVIPLPPLKEQHRIVAKVDELMALCDQLKGQLSEARQHHEQLAQVLVEQAIA